MSRIISFESEIERVLFSTPVYCIAYGCDNDQRNASSTVSFHRLLLKKPSLLKQVRIATE